VRIFSEYLVGRGVYAIAAELAREAHPLPVGPRHPGLVDRWPRRQSPRTGRPSCDRPGWVTIALVVVQERCAVMESSFAPAFVTSKQAAPVIRSLDATVGTPLEVKGLQA
jgi:hypothetical protein